MKNAITSLEQKKARAQIEHDFYEWLQDKLNNANYDLLRAKEALASDQEDAYWRNQVKLNEAIAEILPEAEITF